MTCLIKFISKGAPWRLIHLKIQRQFLFKILFELEHFQLGSLDACVCAFVSLLPRLIKAIEKMHKGLRSRDSLGFFSELKRDSHNPEWRSAGSRGNRFPGKSKRASPSGDLSLLSFALFCIFHLCLILVEPSSSSLTCWQVNSWNFAYIKDLEYTLS